MLHTNQTNVDIPDNLDIDFQDNIPPLTCQVTPDIHFHHSRRFLTQMQPKLARLQVIVIHHPGPTQHFL